MSIYALDSDEKLKRFFDGFEKGEIIINSSLVSEEERKDFSREVSKFLAARRKEREAARQAVACA